MNITGGIPSTFYLSARREVASLVPPSFFVSLLPPPPPPFPRPWPPFLRAPAPRLQIGRALSRSGESTTFDHSNHLRRKGLAKKFLGITAGACRATLGDFLGERGLRW